VVTASGPATATAVVLAALAGVLPANVAAKAGRASHPVQHLPAPVHVACPEALSDGSLVDARLGDVLASLASGIKWDAAGGGAGAPTRCRREVKLHCGPDLDHDGDQEAIVEITSLDIGDGQSCDQAAASAEQAPAVMRYFFLASRHQSTWRAAGRLAVNVDDGGGDPARPAAYFVKQSGGKYGVRVDSYAAHGACEVGGYEVFTLRGGQLVNVARGDLSAPCVPCGCH
jgi:hypothetical protein